MSQAISHWCRSWLTSATPRGDSDTPRHRPTGRLIALARTAPVSQEHRNTTSIKKNTRNDTARVTNNIRGLDQIRREELRRADEEPRRADDLVRRAGNPPRPPDAYEHRRACEPQAAELRRSAEKARRHAESLPVQIRNLESTLS